MAYFLIFFYLINMFFPLKVMAQQEIKPPAMAGTFYPASQEELSSMLSDMMAKVDVQGLFPSRMVLVPHAGYIYSGQTAAYGYAALKAFKPQTILVLAPSHFKALSKPALWVKGPFGTPLGALDLDQDLIKEMQKENDLWMDDEEVFMKEHGLDVEWPWIRFNFPSHIRVVGVIVGQMTLLDMQRLSNLITRLMKDNPQLGLIVSSDLSHYHDQDVAKQMDEATLKTIIQGDIEGLLDGENAGRLEMCGLWPNLIGMLVAKNMGWEQRAVFHYSDSSLRTQDRERVVGYASMGFSESGTLTLGQQRNILLWVKEATRAKMLGQAPPQQTGWQQDPLWFKQRGVFVTWRWQGALRGCIGVFSSQEGLIHTIERMGYSAATDDPRFKPMTLRELDEADVEISILSPMKEIESADEIILGYHGVVISDGQGHQGVFLPQVATETGWTKDEFLRQLCRMKAGLPEDAWKDPHMHLYVFSAQIITQS